MKTCQEIRVDNLKALAQDLGGNAALAKHIGKSEAQVSQWINQSKDSKTGKPRGMSDDIARVIEEKCSKERGWMDNDHSDISLDQFKKLPPELRAWLMRASNSSNEQKENGAQ